MDRCDIKELHYIAPIANVPSIMKDGILSNSLARKVAHHSVAMPEIQERRKNKRIPRARMLHDYAPLYFDAHNPMLSKLREQNDAICILTVDVSVLDLPEVIVTDCNASCDIVRFSPVDEGLKIIDRNRVFAQYWTHPQDPFDTARHKSEKCAEVLVPERVPPSFLRGACVANGIALAAFNYLGISLPVEINSSIFF